MVLPEVVRVNYNTVEVNGVHVFYRESVPVRADAPVLLLLHGFPSSSHQFRRLIDVLGARYRLVAPDYPGFGHTQAPDGFIYNFERLSRTMEALIERLHLPPFVMYVFDFGAPVGFRLAMRHPEWITGLVIQNGNAYKEGLSDAARTFISLRPETPGGERAVLDLLTLDGTRGQYEAGTSDPTLISPDGWTMDQHFLDMDGRKRAQVALAFDYHSNIEQYGLWQEWLREHAPATLVVWGSNDPFFPADGALAYLRDVPLAEVHLFETGHFALEEKLSDIAPLIADFLDRLSTAT